MKDAKALIESNKANAEGKVKEAEEMRESSADVIQVTAHCAHAADGSKRGYVHLCRTRIFIKNSTTIQ